MRAVHDAKQLFLVTAVLEVGAGLGLLLAPAVIVGLLLGPSDIQTGVAVGRLAGAALLALGATSWSARDDGDSTASRALVSGLLIYNAAVVALVLSGTLGTLNPILWTVVAVHGAMALWCATVMTHRPVSARG